MKSALRIALFTLSGLFAVCTFGQTTQLKQTAAGPNCQVTGCINQPLSDGELMTWSDTLQNFGQHNINGKLSFRGINYFMSGTASGNETIDINSTAYENNGFAVHTDFDVDCFRCAYGWDDGYLQLNNEYIGSYPFLYGWNGAINVTSGTGQVGLVTANMVQDQVVTLTSSDTTLIQVPSNITILAGSLDADFTITATAPTASAAPLGAQPVTVTATFPDGTIATMTITIGTIPASPPPSGDDYALPFYPCGSKKTNCFQVK